MLTFVKLGGSLITDKRVEQSFRADVVARIATEIAAALAIARQPLLIGHGSGSFGHFAARRHGTMQGVATPEQWRGFAEVALVAADLNGLIARALWDAGVAIWRIQPSASVVAEDGVPRQMALFAIQSALERGLIPLVYGDVALDSIRGGTIVSTETLFTYLAQALPVSRIVLAGEVPGVLDEHGHLVNRITLASFDDVSGALKGSEGTDVTGGMLSKVSEALDLLRVNPSLRVQIVDGTAPRVLHDALVDPLSDAGTVIVAT